MCKCVFTNLEYQPFIHSFINVSIAIQMMYVIYWDYDIIMSASPILLLWWPQTTALKVMLARKVEGKAGSSFWMSEIILAPTVTHVVSPAVLVHQKIATNLWLISVIYRTGTHGTVGNWWGWCSGKVWEWRHKHTIHAREQVWWNICRASFSKG